MKKTIFQRILAVAVVVTMLFASLHLPSMVEAAPEQELSEITFSDYIDYNPSTGLPEGPIQDGLCVAGDHIIGTVSGKHATLDGVAFNGIVKFTDDVEQNPQNTCIRIGGPSQWNQWPGIGIYYDNGIVLEDFTADATNGVQLCHVQETEPVTFKNKDTIVRLEFQVENQTDLRIVFSMNGTEYYNGVVAGLAGVLGHGILVNGEGASIEIKSYVPEPELERIPSENLTEITPADFGMTAKNITEFEWGTYTGETLNGTRFTTMITLPERQNGTYLRLGGPDEGGWTGLGLKVWKDMNSQLEVTDNSGHTKYLKYIDSKEGEALLGVPVKLDITTEFIDADNDGKENDVFYGIFFNDDLYQTVLLKDHVTYMGKNIMFYTDSAEYPILLEYEDKEPEWTPSEDLTVITPADFGMTAKNITAFEHGTYEGVVLDGTRFTTMITLPERQNGTYLRYGGTDTEGWTGLGLKVWKSDTSELEVSDNSGNTSYIDYIASKEGKALLGMPVKLDITTEFIDADDDGKEDDVLYGIFFDDELYKTIVFNDHTQYVGKKIMFYTDSSDYPIHLGYEVEEIQKPELQSVTMQSMGIMDGKYTFCGDLVAQGSHTDTLVGTTLTQKITFSEHGGTWFQYAGGPSAWHGIRFKTQEDGSITFQSSDGEFTNVGVLTPEIAGTALLGEEIELGIELFENGDNVMMGIYINGVLYNDQYFTLLGAKGKLGNYAAFNVANEEGYVIIGKPVAAPSVDGSFKKITFNSYDIESDTYKYDPLGLSASGDCGLTSLNRVVFSDVVNFSDAAGVQMRFGGKTSPWEGLVWESIGDGKLQLTAATGGFPAMVFDSETAGVKLTGNDVELTFSFEYVDSDGDGAKDDVKLGVWFDGKAYNNRWIYLRDYAEKLGGYLGVYCPNEQTTLKIHTYMPPIDFAEFGFTANWAVELGLKKK